MQPIILQTLTVEEFLSELNIDIERMHSKKILTNIQMAPAPPDPAIQLKQGQAPRNKRNVYLHASAILRFGDDIYSYYILRATIFTGVHWLESQQDEKSGSVIAFKALEEIGAFCDANKLTVGSGLWRFPNEEV